jgi:hypothetical protein
MSTEKFCTATWNGRVVFFWATQADLYSSDKVVDVFEERNGGEMVVAEAKIVELEGIEPVQVVD